MINFLSTFFSLLDLTFGHVAPATCILTNDWDNSEKAIIEYYNKRGASERNFDCQNNDFERPLP